MTTSNPNARPLIHPDVMTRLVAREKNVREMKQAAITEKLS